MSPGDRRSELLDVGVEVFGQRPYAEVHIKDIAERAGVSPALMKHYFPGRRAFFTAVIKEHAERLFKTAITPPRPGQTLFHHVRIGVLSSIDYHQRNPHAACSAYAGLARCDPALLDIVDAAKNRQMRRIMARLAKVSSPANEFDADVERALQVIIYGWLAFTFEVCRQHVTQLATDAHQLSKSCAHALLDAVARVPRIPPELSAAVAPDQRCDDPRRTQTSTPRALKDTQI